jgi:hypothetical protein
MNFPDATLLLSTFLIPRTQILFAFSFSNDFVWKNVLGWVSFEFYPFSSPADTTELQDELQFDQSLSRNSFLFLFFFKDFADVLKEHAVSISRVEMSAIMIRAIFGCYAIWTLKINIVKYICYIANNYCGLWI